MTIPKKKNQRRRKAPAKGRAPQPRNPNSLALPKVPPALVRQVCGLSDPFCPHAMGAKMPDNSGIRSLTYPLHLRTTITTNSFGNGSMLFVPNYFYAPFTAAATMTGTVANFSDPLVAGARLSNVSQYRISSFGVKIRNITPPLTSQGMVSVRGFASKTGASYAGIASQTYNADFSEDVALQNCRELAVVAKRLDPSSVWFKTPASTTPTAVLTDWVSPGYGCFTVSIIGGPASTTALDVEIFLNMEVSFDDSETLQLLATPSPLSNPMLTNAVDQVSSQAKSVFLEGAKQAGSYFVKAGTAALLQAISARFPPAKMAAMAITVD